MCVLGLFEFLYDCFEGKELSVVDEAVLLHEANKRRQRCLQVQRFVLFWDNQTHTHTHGHTQHRTEQNRTNGFL